MHGSPIPPTAAQLNTFPLKRCKGCPHGFARLVGSKGPPDSPFVIVGESPGKEEVKQGLPFVGPSGVVLEHALSQHPEIKPYYLNAFQCYPGTPGKNKTQEKVVSATQCCQGRLYHELKSYPRKVILALGNSAVWATTNQFGSKITQVRGKLYEVPTLASRGIIAAVHPAFLLRGSGSMRQFMADVDYALRLSKGAPTKRYVLPEVHVAKSYDNIVWLAHEIAKHEYCAADIETGGYDGFDHLRDRILCTGFCWDPAHVYVIPEDLIRHLDIVFRVARNTRFIWHNGKFDQKFFWAKGIPECRVDEDTMLLSYALDETKGIHDLEQLASDILGAPDWKFMIQPYLQDWKSAHKGQPLPGYDPVPRDILYDYMSRDISGTLQIFPFLRNLVRMDPMSELEYTRTLIPYSQYLARIEMKGMLPDLNQVEKNRVEKQALADSLELAFNKLAVEAGFGSLNPRSPKQVASFLYGTLQLRDPRRPKKVPDSTDEDTLNTLWTSLQDRTLHPAVQVLLKYREVQKGLSTYVNSIPEHIGADNRVHSTYLIHGTTTGRPASRNPNVLNIPREPLLRGQFIATPGNILLDIDVNQAELRVLAELSGDPILEQIYLDPSSPSIHKVTQTEMFGDPLTYDEHQWTTLMDKFSCPGDRLRMLDEQNMRAKCVNFGIVYGRTAPSIAEEFRMPVDEAQSWINAWFKKYAVAREFILSCREAPLKGRNLVTCFGRKRRFQVVTQEKLNDIQNQAANFFEQSIACDVVTHTGIRIQEQAKDVYGADIINSVYDSIMFEMPNDPDKYLELGALTLKRLGETAREWGLRKIPFKGDLKIGTRWGSDPGNKYPGMGFGQKVKIPDHIKQKVDLQ